MTLQTDLQAAVDKATLASDKLDNIVNGDSVSTVTTDNGEVKTMAKVVADNEATLSASIADVTTKRDEAAASATAAQTSADDAAAIVLSINLPAITITDAGKTLTVNPSGDGYNLINNGTANQVLTSNGAGNPPSWQDQSGGLGGTWADWKPQYMEQIGRISNSIRSNGGYSEYYATCQIDDNTFAVGGKDYDTANRRRTVVYRKFSSGNSASSNKYGSVNAISASALAKLDTNKYVHIFGGDNTSKNIKAVAATVPPTAYPTITEGAEITLNATDYSFALDAIQMETDKVLVVGHAFDVSYDIFAQVVTASGTVLTGGAAVVISNGNPPASASVRCSKVSNTRAVVAFRDANNNINLGLIGLTAGSSTALVDLGELTVIDRANTMSYASVATIDTNTAVVMAYDTVDKAIYYAIVDITGDSISVTTTGKLADCSYIGGYSTQILNLGGGEFAVCFEHSNEGHSTIVFSATTTTVTVLKGGTFSSKFKTISASSVQPRLYDTVNEDIKVFSVSGVSGTPGIELNVIKKSLT